MNDHQRQQRESSLWNKLAASYDSRTLTAFQEAYKLSIEKTREILAGDEEVIDIGCGTGIICLGIADKARRVVGTDISPQMIAVAERKLKEQGCKNVELRLADGYALPYADASFDVALLFNALHVVKEPAALLREARRLLRPGGRLVCAVDCYAEAVPFPIRVRLSLQRLAHWLGVIPYVWYYRKSDVEKLLQAHGFAIRQRAVLQAVPVNYFLCGE